MEAREFFKVQDMICSTNGSCEGCPLYNGMDCYAAFGIADDGQINRVIDIVEKWSAEHPQKTRLDDLKEKYPDVPLNRDGVPSFVPQSLGYCRNKTCGVCDDYRLDGFKSCWNTPLEEQPVRKDEPESCESCETCKYSGVIGEEYYCYRGKPEGYTCKDWEERENA